MNKNRRIIGTPQNSSVIDEIRQIFDVYRFQEGFEVEKIITEIDFYEIRLPPHRQFIGTVQSKLMREFCAKHKCHFWVGSAGYGSLHDRMWIRFGYFDRSPGS